jgi:hypothetical protein
VSANAYVHLAGEGEDLARCGASIEATAIRAPVCPICEESFLLPSLAPGLRRALVVARSLKYSLMEIEPHLELARISP